MGSFVSGWPGPLQVALGGPGPPFPGLSLNCPRLDLGPNGSFYFGHLVGPRSNQWSDWSWARFGSHRHCRWPRMQCASMERDPGSLGSLESALERKTLGALGCPGALGCLGSLGSPLSKKDCIVITMRSANPISHPHRKSLGLRRTRMDQATHKSMPQAIKQKNNCRCLRGPINPRDDS